jgi:hypothetical protein
MMPLTREDVLRIVFEWFNRQVTHPHALHIAVIDVAAARRLAEDVLAAERAAVALEK